MHGTHHKIGGSTQSNQQPGDLHRLENLAPLKHSYWLQKALKDIQVTRVSNPSMVDQNELLLLGPDDLDCSKLVGGSSLKISSGQGLFVLICSPSTPLNEPPESRVSKGQKLLS
jgi:hypothetical protein